MWGPMSARSATKLPFLHLTISPFTITYDVMGGKGKALNRIYYMESSCLHVFMLLNYMKAYVSMYFFHLMLRFSPQNDVMVNSPLHTQQPAVRGGIKPQSVRSTCSFYPYPPATSNIKCITHTSSVCINCSLSRITLSIC